MEPALGLLGQERPGQLALSPATARHRQRFVLSDDAIAGGSGTHNRASAILPGTGKQAAGPERPSGHDTQHSLDDLSLRPYQSR